MPAQFSETTAQLWLENHDERHREKDGETADDPTDDDEVQQLRNQRQGEKNDREAGQDFRAASAAKIEVAVIDANAKKQDLDKTSPALDPELEELVHHGAAVFKSASV